MLKAIELKDHEKTLQIIFWASLGAFMILKYSYYGIAYFPVLDDWIQYGTHPFFDNPFESIILKGKTYSTRPLAAIFDPYVWGAFWNHMWIALGIITTLHYVSMYFIHKIFKEFNIRLGYISLLIYGGLPLGIEGTYWISASSRIIFGLFMASLAAYLLMLYCQKPIHKKGRIALLIGFILIHLASLCFYEQVIPISVVSSGLLLFLWRKKVKPNWLHAVPWIHLIAIGGYYLKFMSTGWSAQRSHILGVSLLTRMDTLGKNIKNLWVDKQLRFMYVDSRRGLKIMLQDHAYLFLIGIVLLAIIVFMYVMVSKYDRDKKQQYIKIVLGITLFIMPYVPFLVLDSGGEYLRNTVTSLLGLGLTVEGIVELLVVKPQLRFLKGLVASGLIVVFVVCHVSVLNFYKVVSQDDVEIADNIIAIIEDVQYNAENNPAIIFNPKKNYIDQNYLYGNAIGSGTSSDWALTGLLRAVSKNIYLRYVHHVPNYATRPIKEEYLNEYVLIGLTNDGNPILLEADKKSDTTILLLTPTKELFGTVTLKDEETIRFELD